MDTYCIERGTLLDNPLLETLRYPDQHSIHCLIEVSSCVNSGYEVLVQSTEGGQPMYERAVKLDEIGNNDILELARETGICSTCSESGSQRYGFAATVTGFIDPSMEESNSGPPRFITTRVMSADVSCDELQNSSLLSNNTGAPASPQLLSAPTTAPTSEAPITGSLATNAPVAVASTTESPITDAPKTASPTTEAPTDPPTTQPPTTQPPITQAPTTQPPTTQAPITQPPTTQAPITQPPTTQAPTTQVPTTQVPTTPSPSELSTTGPTRPRRTRCCASTTRGDRNRIRDNIFETRPLDSPEAGNERENQRKSFMIHSRSPGA